MADKTIKRYDPELNGVVRELPTATMEECHGGDYVLFSDYQRLAEINAELVEACINALNDFKSLFQYARPETEWTIEEVTDHLRAAIAKAEGTE